MNEPQQADRKRALLKGALIVVWGVVLSGYLVRGFFGLADDEIHGNHESATYVYRVIEFRAALAHGHLSPQWCPDFRGGLGSPFFSYYQPAFFYAASAVPPSVAPAKMLGITVIIFAVGGYLGMVALVSRFFDRLSGVVAGSMLLLSPYSGTELYVRGDLSEFAAMMCLPPLLWALFSCVDAPTRGAWLTLVGVGGLLVCTHPCVALPAFGLMGLLLVYFVIDEATRMNAVQAGVAVGLGGLLAGFYCLPVFLEIDLVGHEAAFTDFYHYSNHFISPLRLLGGYTRETLIPFTLGNAVLLCILVNAGWLGYRWRELEASQRRVLIALCLLSLVSIFLMTPYSRFLWQNISMLQRLQFPWRLLAILTVAAAGLCGPVLLFVEQRLRALAAAGVVAMAFWMSLAYTAPNLPTKFDMPQSAAAMASGFVAPDLRNEWMPKDAAVEFPDGRPESYVAEGVSVTQTPDRPSGLRDHTNFTLHVVSRAGGRIHLPHYYFPVGWQATLDGDPVPLTGDEFGLMQVEVPPNSEGTLVVDFHMTPARRYGWLLTAGALFVTILLATFWRRLLAPADTAGSTVDRAPA